MTLSFGERIRNLREDSDLNQSQLGKALNMTQRKISYIECGKYEPSIEDIVAFCKYFNDFGKCISLRFLQLLNAPILTLIIPSGNSIFSNLLQPEKVPSFKVFIFFGNFIFSNFSQFLNATCSITSIESTKDHMFTMV